MKAFFWTDQTQHPQNIQRYHIVFQPVYDYSQTAQPLCGNYSQYDLQDCRVMVLHNTSIHTAWGYSYFLMTKTTQHFGLTISKLQAKGNQRT